MWIVILLILNILIFGVLLFILRGLDGAPKFEIPDDERVEKPSELIEAQTTNYNTDET